MKRIFDLLFSIGALLLLSPVMTLIALVVRVSSKGPVLYRQTRVGKGGETFECLKFRTMFVDAEERLEDLLVNSDELKQEWEEHYKLSYDPRVTRVGLWLRRYSLDELPQFWNVVRGELAVVGPRPVTVEEIEQYYGPSAGTKVLTIRPGLTGPWQVSGRNRLPYPERVRLDLDYVQKSNLLWDIQLILKTVPVMISGDGT